MDRSWYGGSWELGRCWGSEQEGCLRWSTGDGARISGIGGVLELCRRRGGWTSCLICGFCRVRSREEKKWRERERQIDFHITEILRTLSVCLCTSARYCEMAKGDRRDYLTRDAEMTQLRPQTPRFSCYLENKRSS